MLQDNYGQDDPSADQGQPHKPQVEYVGSPTEFANEAEVPEGVALLAKAFAGGWLLLVVAGLLGGGCAVCAIASFLLGLASR